MAYATYITDALVCGVKNSNTSDCSYLLFTRDAGMLFAAARSVRTERSKQRFALQEFSLIRVTLIRGKAGWRIGSVEPAGNYYQNAIDKPARGSVVKIFRLLRRFIHGEEKESTLFDFTVESLKLVNGEVEKRAFVDDVIQLRILNLLGYVSSKKIPTALLTTPLIDLAKVHNESLQNNLGQILEHAVSVTHL